MWVCLIFEKSKTKVSVKVTKVFELLLKNPTSSLILFRYITRLFPVIGIGSGPKVILTAQESSDSAGCTKLLLVLHYSLLWANGKGKQMVIFSLLPASQNKNDVRSIRELKRNVSTKGFACHGIFVDCHNLECGLFPGSMDMLYIKSTNLGKTETGDHAASRIKLSHQRLAAQKQAL